MFENRIPELKLAWASLIASLLWSVPTKLVERLYTSEQTGFLLIYDFNISVKELCSAKARILNSNPRYWNLYLPYFSCFILWNTRPRHNSTKSLMWQSKKG